jgi:hypothetical protein
LHALLRTYLFFERNALLRTYLFFERKAQDSAYFIDKEGVTTG